MVVLDCFLIIIFPLLLHIAIYCTLFLSYGRLWSPYRLFWFLLITFWLSLTPLQQLTPLFAVSMMSNGLKEDHGHCPRSSLARNLFIIIWPLLISLSSQNVPADTYHIPMGHMGRRVFKGGPIFLKATFKNSIKTIFIITIIV